MGQIEPKHRSTLCARPPSRPTSVANIRPKHENVENRRNVRFLKKINIRAEDPDLLVFWS